jgi:hypothetical protein
MRENYHVAPYRTDEQIQNDDLLQWVYDSHCWLDAVNSISTCKWCGYSVNGYQGVKYLEIPVCKNNPKILDMK